MDLVHNGRRGGERVLAKSISPFSPFLDPKQSFLALSGPFLAIIGYWIKIQFEGFSFFSSFFGWGEGGGGTESVTLLQSQVYDLFSLRTQSIKGGGGYPSQGPTL